VNVYQAALLKIEEAILTHEDYYVSFSGGKDSGVLLNLVIEVATRLNRLPVKTVFSDLEIIFEETSRYTQSMMDRPDVEPYWLCLAEIENNASSVYQRYFKYWGKNEQPWSRDMPSMPYVINEDNIPDWLAPYYTSKTTNEWTITRMGEALCDKNGTADIVNFIGMRDDESYGRLMNVRCMKNRDKKNPHTYRYVNGSTSRTWICLPIHDWKVADVWHYYAVNNLDYNRVYDAMWKMGIPPHEQRTCFAFGEEQSKTLNQWCVIEPDTWDRMVYRVQGANFGKLYNHTRINSGKVKKPDNLTWKEYTKALMASLPEEAREIFEEKFKIVFWYHKHHYEEKEGISPDIYIQDNRKQVKEMMKKTGLAQKYFITWETLASAIIKRDFVFKKYGFGYSKKMQDKIERLYDKWQDI
jgi:predicted phosphoadenosine phosphosulfate sulfurtransferase